MNVSLDLRSEGVKSPQDWLKNFVQFSSFEEVHLSKLKKNQLLIEITSFCVSENPVNDTKDGLVNREKKVCCLTLIQEMIL